MKESEARTVACPTCGAAVGERCTRPVWGVPWRREPVRAHAARKRVAADARLPITTTGPR